MSEQKGLIFATIAVSLVGIAAGVFLGRDGLPSLAAQQQNGGNTTTTTTTISVKVVNSYDGIPNHDEKITTNTTVMKVVHSDDGIPMHEHTITVIITTNETTPDGNFHDFRPAKATSANQTAAVTTPMPGM